MSSYLDTSALLPILIAEPTTEAVYDCLGAKDQELLISDFAAAEVASALSRLVRMALLSDADALARLVDFDAWRAAMSSPVDVTAADARLAYIYARRFDLRLRAPDALHLAIARRLDATLVTLDRRLAAAARELGGPSRCRRATKIFGGCLGRTSRSVGRVERKRNPPGAPSESVAGCAG